MGLCLDRKIRFICVSLLLYLRLFIIKESGIKKEHILVLSPLPYPHGRREYIKSVIGSFVYQTSEQLQPLPYQLY